MTTRTRALELDLLRCLAIAAMVCLHVLGSWWLLCEPGPVARRVAMVIHDACQMCVPVLLLLSMLLMARHQPGGGGLTVVRWLGTRLAGLLPATLIWAVLYALLAGWLHAQGLWAGWFTRFWLGPLGTLPETAVHLWYMFVLLQLVPLFPGVRWLVERVVAGQPFRAQVLLGGVLILKRAFCGSVFRPEGAREWAGWVGMAGPFWLDLVVFALVWSIPGALKSEGSERTTRWAWLGLLVFTGFIDAWEVQRLLAAGVPELYAHSNWRFGNSLYGMAVFATVLSFREPLERLIPEWLARHLQRFSQRASFGFYLAHVLPLTLAGNLLPRLGLGAGTSLLFLAVTTVGGTLVLLWLLAHVPVLGGWMGLRPPARDGLTSGEAPPPAPGVT